MTSKRAHEGEILIDSRFTPGIPEDVLRITGLPPEAGRGLYEAPTYTCSHCQRVVMMNPGRTRERGYCTGCDHYLCDQCGTVRAALGGVCRTFKQIIDEVQEAGARGLPASPLLILGPDNRPLNITPT